MFDPLAYSQYQDQLEDMREAHEAAILGNQLAATQAMLGWQQQEQALQLEEATFLAQNPGARSLFARCNAAFAQGFNSVI